MQRGSKFIAALLAVAVTFGASPVAANWLAFAGGPLERMKADDLRIAGAAIQRALVVGDAGERVVWSNPQTGAHGTVIVLSARPHPGRPCRRLAIAAHARGVEEKGVWTLCRAGNAWTLGPPDGPAQDHIRAIARHNGDTLAP